MSVDEIIESINNLDDASRLELTEKVHTTQEGISAFCVLNYGASSNIQTASQTSESGADDGETTPEENK